MSSIEPSQAPMLSSVADVQVDGLRFVGNTAFTDAQLLAAPLYPASTTPTTLPAAASVTGPQPAIGDRLGRRLTLEDLEQIRVAVTLAYVNAGYINSGAVIDDQAVDPTGGNAIVVRVVEGRLGEVNLSRTGKGWTWLRDAYVTDRVRRAAAEPFNVLRLRDQLELLRQDPRLDRINAELRPTDTPGEALLDVAIEEAVPLHLGVRFSNRSPPSVGSERIDILAADDNLLGFGDALSLRYGLNQGDLDDWHWAGLDDFDLDYTVPITPADTTVSLNLSRSDSTLVEAPFDELDLDTQSTKYGLFVRHPLMRTPTRELAVFAGATAQHVRTRLAGERIDLSPGSVEGDSNVAALRFGVDFAQRSARTAVSLRSTFSLGVDAFDATLNAGDIPDSQFFTWLGQAQYVRRLGEGNAQLVLRGAAQLTPDSLLPAEQFAIGGMDTVRGYRENTIVRDNGVVGTVEVRLPLLSRQAGQVPVLTLAPFVDAGYGFNRDQRPVGEFLVSVGAGLIFTPNDNFDARLYFGQKLNDFTDDEGDDNLQDLGIHFSIEYRAF